MAEVKEKKNRIGVIQMLVDLQERVKKIEEELGIDPDAPEEEEGTNSGTTDEETGTSVSL